MYVALHNGQHRRKKKRSLCTYSTAVSITIFILSINIDRISQHIQQVRARIVSYVYSKKKKKSKSILRPDAAKKNTYTHTSTQKACGKIRCNTCARHAQNPTLKTHVRLGHFIDWPRILVPYRIQCICILRMYIYTPYTDFYMVPPCSTGKSI